MTKITLVGDMLCEPLMLKAAKKKDGSYDFRDVFSDTRQLFESADYVIANLETVIAGKELKYTDDLLSFNAPGEFAVAVKNAGVDLVNTANNHSMDRGEEGFYNTLRFLDSIGLPHTGTYLSEDEEKVYYAEVNGVKIAVISYVYNMNYALHHRVLKDEKCVNILKPQNDYVYAFQTQKIKTPLHIRLINKMLSPLGYEKKTYVKKFLGLPYSTARADDYLNIEKAEPYIHQMQTQIREAKSKADVVIFYPHIGGQFNLQPGVFSEYVVDKAVDAGADAVIACHAHIVQKATMAGTVPCFYSIGNFCMSPNSVYLLHENLPDYGIAVHLYLEEGVQKVTFSILKMIENKKDIMRVYPVDKLYQSLKTADERDQLVKDIRQIYHTVTGKKLKQDAVCAEYLFFADK